MKRRKVIRHAKKPIRYKILLDEGLPPRQAYLNLNRLHYVAHIAHDFNLNGSPDSIVYKKATDESRIMIVFNTKDFRKLLRRDKPTIVALSPSLSNKQADLKLCKLLRDLKQKQTRGLLISVSKSGIVKLSWR